MKLTIFGATGSIGRHIVAQALERAHEVTAFVRDPGKFDQVHENLKIVQGDVLDPASIASAIEGQDAVLCALGMPLMNKDGLRAEGTQNIVRAMEGSDVKRLICLSGLGAGDSWDILPLFHKYFLIPVVLRHVYADHEAQEKIVKNSRLDWTLVRPGSFAEGRRTGMYRHGFTAPDSSLKFKISRKDVADFMLKQITDRTYLHLAPTLSY